MLHKVKLLAVCGVVSVACQSQKSEDMHNEIMVIHDEVMPKQDNLMSLKSKLDSLSKTSSDTLVIKKLYEALDSSDNAMMSWMQNYDVEKIATMTDADKKNYYSTEKKKITDVKIFTNKSIEEAALYLKQIK